MKTEADYQYKRYVKGLARMFKEKTHYLKHIKRKVEPIPLFLLPHPSQIKKKKNIHLQTAGMTEFSSCQVAEQ